MIRFWKLAQSRKFGKIQTTQLQKILFVLLCILRAQRENQKGFCCRTGISYLVHRGCTPELQILTIPSPMIKVKKYFLERVFLHFLTQIFLHFLTQIFLHFLTQIFLHF